MGIPFVAVKMPKCFGIQFLLEFLTFIKLLFLLILYNLGMFKSAAIAAHRPYFNPDEDQDPTENYVLIMDELSPSPIPVPVSVLTGLIKKKLPVISYSSLVERLGKKREEDDHDSASVESMCPVCLDCLEERDEVRELHNCCHVFHRKCLDSWMDQGQVTCPTCRSVLFPKKMGAAAMSVFACDDSDHIDEQFL